MLLFFTSNLACLSSSRISFRDFLEDSEGSFCSTTIFFWKKKISFSITILLFLFASTGEFDKGDWDIGELDAGDSEMGDPRSNEK